MKRAFAVVDARGRYLLTREGAPRWSRDLSEAAIWARRVNAGNRASAIGARVALLEVGPPLAQVAP